MGPINDVFSQNKLSLKKFGEILSFLINTSKNKNQNNKILNEIGLINEYAQVISDKEPNEIIYCSKKYKIVQNIKFLIKMRENFLKWVKYFFDINNNDLDSINKFNSFFLTGFGWVFLSNFVPNNIIGKLSFILNLVLQL